MIRILIVDDQPNIRSSLVTLLSDEGHLLECAQSGEEAVRRFEENDWDIVLLDVIMSGMDGLDTLARIHRMSPSTKVFMMSGQSDFSTAVKATKMGATDFFEKPLNPDRVLVAIRQCVDRIAMEKKVDSLEHLVDQEDELIGQSLPMQKLRETIARAAPSDGRVFIMGENGTGKELVARAVHRGSRRRGQPFVSLNCAALPRDLVESELFGYEKGAFTGAVSRKPGRFETADRGTLFLDEVGDMHPDTQAKLLRVLEEGEAVRLGGSRPIRFDVRVISATNKDIRGEVEKGRFREDLLYRLNVIPIEVPPLRARREDIPLFARHFLQRIGVRTGKGLRRWDNEALQDLQEYNWPGNVRELRNTVERLIIMSDRETINAADVAGALPSIGKPAIPAEEKPAWNTIPLKERLKNLEKEVLAQGFQETGGNISGLARILGVERAHLSRKLTRYGIGIKPDQPRKRKRKR